MQIDLEDLIQAIEESTDDIEFDDCDGCGGWEKSLIDGDELVGILTALLNKEYPPKTRYFIKEETHEENNSNS